MKALVLSGGGSKGAYEVGALQYLLVDAKMQYEILCGVSVGALNTSFLSMYPIGQEVLAMQGLKALWDGLNTKSIYRQWFPLSYLEALWKPSVFNSKPLQNIVRTKLDPVKIKTSGHKLRIGACGLDTGEYRLFDENYDKIQEAVLASAAFPAMLLPIQLEGQLWTDGGVKSVTPIKAAIDAGATFIDVVMCSPPNDASSKFMAKTNAIAVAQRAIDLMGDQIEDNDLKICNLVNNIVSLWGMPDKRHIELRIIRPNSIILKNSLDFNPINLQRMFSQGYQDAKTI